MSSRRVGRARRLWRGGIALAIAVAAAGTSVLFGQQPRAIDFGAEGSGVARWRSQGDALWRIERNEATARVSATGASGWLVSDRGYQDLNLTYAFQCTGGCQTGVLLGIQKAGDNRDGIYVSLTDPDLAGYDMTIDAQGKEVARRAPEAGAGRGGRGGGGGGAGGRGAASATPQATAGLPLARPRPSAKVDPGGWNLVEVRVFVPANALSPSVQVVLNGITVNTGLPAATAGPGMGRTDRLAVHPDPMGRFGPIAIRAAGSASAEVRIRNLSITNFNEIVPTVEHVGSRFRMQQVQPYFYGDGSAVGDLNHDGVPDVLAGPIYWLGPDFTRGRQIDVTRPLDLNDYAGWLGQEIADFNGDGWNDVVATAWPGGSPLYLFVNPHDELRRWSRYKVVENISEIFTLADIDRDGRQEFVYGGDGYGANYAKFDPANPTAPWKVYHLTEVGNWGSHGLGVGDVNGDGRLDVLRAWGWWEQPPDPTQVPWAFHPAVLGRNGPAAGPGGAQMQVYDVNGDGLADVVTSMEAHGYGLAWYEQKRTGADISFVEHVIMDKAGDSGVFFTELHGLALADVDGDGLKDIVTGKNKYSYGGYWEFLYPNEDADGVLYWFKLTRRSGGQVQWTPHLIHNNSGVGRQPRIVDLNGDGLMDIVNSGRFGTLLFFGKKGDVDR